MNDRLNKLLARQAAAVEERRRNEQRASEVAELAAARRAEVEQLWIEKSGLLDKAIAELNAAMASNEVQLYRRWTDDGPATEIARVDIGFTECSGFPKDTLSMMCHVAAKGNIHVRMATRNQMPAKEDHFTLEEVDLARWMTCLFDFVDINTPE